MTIGNPISASMDTLFKQSTMTASHYLDHAVRSIDERFDQGYAREHPDLVAAYMFVACADFTGAVLAKALFELAENTSLVTKP